MSKKLFSLINGSQLHVAPKTKVIAAKEFSTLLDASEVLELVQKDAETYKIKEVEDCEELKAQAQREGFEAGFKSWAEMIAKQEAEIKKVRAEIEKMIAPVALKAAKKILGREMELSNEVIVDIVSTSLKSVAQHKKITIHVNKKDYASLEANRPRLRELFESLESLSIRESSDVQSGGCIIETEGGIINAQLENQWRILEKAFENLLKQKSIAQE
ncbi:MAG: HrpE/YscL family type III secretion apparatus protein [Parachlamydiaceae bacterium]